MTENRLEVQIAILDFAHIFQKNYASDSYKMDVDVTRDIWRSYHSNISLLLLPVFFLWGFKTSKTPIFGHRTSAFINTLQVSKVGKPI